LYDVVIVGAGPAGISAGIYSVRYGLDVLVVDMQVLGGQIAVSRLVENYPGFREIRGRELMEAFIDHAKAAGVDIRMSAVEKIVKSGDGFELSTDSAPIRSRAVIIATGASPLHLDVPGEFEFTGRGVSYCATCDGPFFSGKEVVVAGGGESAITDALVLSDIARKVTVIHRRDSLRASRVLQDRAFGRDNIEFVWNTTVEAIRGDKHVESLLLKNTQTREESVLKADGVFIYVGITPNTDLVDAKKNAHGFILTDESMATSVPGMFAAGDCRASPLYQVVTAVADGAIAAFSARKFVREQ
jgi:thioredoxin reductase (NADPH)